MTILALIVFGLIVLWMSVYGYVISSKTSEDYMLAGRGIGILVMFFFMLFSISSAWTFYGYPGYLYTHGPGYVFFIWGCVAGFAGLYMFLGPRVWAVARLNRFLSPVEMMSQRYESKALRVILAVLLLAFIVPYVGIQPLGVGLGFEALTGMSRMFGIAYTVVLLLLVVFLGGMRTTAWVNVFLGLVYAATFLGSLVWIVAKVFPGGLSEAAQVVAQNRPDLLSAPGPEGYFSHVTIAGLLIVGMLAFSWPHVVIGTMTARDKLIFKWLPLLAIVAAGFLFYTIPFIWGAIVAPAISLLPDTLVPPMSGKEADNVVQVIITQYLPRWFSTFVLMGVIAASISTAAVQLMTSGILVSRDLIHGFFRPDATDRQLILWTKGAIVALLLLTFGIAAWNPARLADYLTSVSVPGFAQWAPCLLGAVLWRRGTRQGAIAGVLGGTLVLVAGYIIAPGNAALLGKLIIGSLVLNGLLYVVVSLVTPPPSAEVQSRFFDEVDDFLSVEV
ncbi:MAG: sodium:solute symporter family protein [Chitinivibrionales bacterium]|nr:sodium:solute symporter family protein [Chitinivibrionales bacterium]MBD3395417.1 sodium:solute symporter family protein [Chitinivibrionales bacterium]